MMRIGILRPSRRLGWLAVVMVVVACAAGQLRAQEKNTTAVFRAFREVVAKPS